MWQVLTEIFILVFGGEKGEKYEQRDERRAKSN